MFFHHRHDHCGFYDVAFLFSNLGPEQVIWESVDTWQFGLCFFFKSYLWKLSQQNYLYWSFQYNPPLWFSLSESLAVTILSCHFSLSNICLNKLFWGQYSWLLQFFCLVIYVSAWKHVLFFCRKKCCLLSKENVEKCEKTRLHWGGYAEWGWAL